MKFQLTIMVIDCSKIASIVKSVFGRFQKRYVHCFKKKICSLFPKRVISNLKTYVREMRIKTLYKWLQSSLAALLPEKSSIPTAAGNTSMISWMLRHAWRELRVDIERDDRERRRGKLWSRKCRVTQFIHEPLCWATRRIPSPSPHLSSFECAYFRCKLVDSLN